ncbi:MAG: tetratricopeptide repeat protein, partial [Planctomycetota bacterium]|nr:tetratricopeptide repeat protein [Planctomycetota bacterium]
YVICGLIVLAATVGLAFYRRRVPAIATCAIVYTILVFPVLGFVQSGNQEVADRYSYLPCVAWSALLAAGVLILWNRGLWFRIAAGGLTVLVTLQLAVLTREQCGVWKNTAALWTRAWMLQPDSSLAQNSYAFSVLMRQGRFEEAVPHLRRAIEIKGDNDKAHYNLHTALSRLNRNDELFEAYQHTLRVFARYERSTEVRASAHFRLGNMLYLRKEFDAAIKHFRDALALRPNHASTHGTLSAALERKKDREGAKRHASRALELDPSLIPPRRVLARALRSEGRLEDAIAQLREALRHDPDNARTKKELGRMTQSP